MLLGEALLILKSLLLSLWGRIVHNPDTLVLLDTIVEVVMVANELIVLLYRGARHALRLVRADSIGGRGRSNTGMAHPCLVEHFDHDPLLFF